MRPQLLPLALALLVAVPSGAQEGRSHPAPVFAGPEVTTEAGSTVSLPCNLTGPRLTWQWIPRYPVCAGVRGGIKMKTIYTVTAAGAHDALEGRFQTRLRLLMSQGSPTYVLELQTLHMNDSGVFFCASPSQKAPPTSVTIMPGCQAGVSIEGVPKEPVVEGASVSLSCAPCGEQGPTSPPAGGATWRLNGKRLPNSTVHRLLRSNKVTIGDFSSRLEGLWSCHLPGDPPRSGGYCLERDPGAHGTQESPSPTSPGPSPTLLLPLVGGCVGAALGLLLVGVVAVICQRRRRPRDARVTPMVTEMDGKSEQAVEHPGPTEAGGAEQKPPSSDPHPVDEGPEGIQYSTLHFPAPHGAGAMSETSPATIYSKLATGHG
ncbi:uncharacterized protein LOC114022020 isoform X2 [Chelonia mydas]|uniref:uncharacterized protein LOC114022020 isoform X2 n=1 Tax=Chelonia mydas TaxID=8469 RepID=UPI0018A1E347|nr:uncharacterized protein LOC114022020 isoform X2 [Chelonia mydas]